MTSRKHADFLFSCMLIASFLISFVIVWYMLPYLETHSGSFRFIRELGSAIVMSGDESGKFHAGLFLIPFSILGGASWFIYSRLLKGTIDKSRNFTNPNSGRRILFLLVVLGAIVLWILAAAD